MTRPRLRSLSFRVRLLLYGAAVGGISLLSAIAIFLVNDEIGYRESFASLARTQAQILSSAGASAVVFDDANYAARCLAGLEGSPEVRGAAIYRGDGTILATYERDGLPYEFPPFPPVADQFFADGRLTTTQPVRFRGQAVGWIHLQSELPSYTSRLGAHVAIAFGVLAVSLLVSLGFARSLQKPIAQPVRELQNAARSMAEGGDTSVQARKFAEDELGDLTDSLNEMFRQIQAREGELRESRLRFSGLLDRLGEAVFRMTVPGGEFEYCSPAARGVFGYPASDFLARPRFLERIVHAGDRERLQTDLRRLEHGEVAPAWEYRIEDAAGRVRWIYQTNSATRDGAGRIVALESCCTDISLRRQADEEKRRLEAELAQAHKLEALGNLAGGIAHDFNNLLGAIIGYRDLAAGDLDESHPAQVSLDRIGQAASRATGLTRQILSFSRRNDTGRQPIDLGRTTREAMELMRATLPATIAIRTEIEEGACVVHANADEMHRMVMNLCTNASHAMAGGTGELHVQLRGIRVTVGSRRGGSELNEGTYAELAISDTGHGIPLEIRDRIFEPFFTTKPTGQGTGMGLAVVYGLVKDAGGVIEVENRIGGGTCFRILLPRLQLEPPAAAAPARVDVRTGGRVLFVDDEDLLADLAERALQTRGFEVEAHTSPRQALAEFRKAPQAFDILLTDLTMPAMTGLELTREVLALRPDLPVVLCSGYTDEATRNAAREAGIHGIATKPLDVEQIDGLIRAALDGHPLPVA